MHVLTRRVSAWTISRQTTLMSFPGRHFHQIGVPWNTCGTMEHLWISFDFIECFTTTFLRAHSWLNCVDDDDDEDEVGLKEKPEDTRYIKKMEHMWLVCWSLSSLCHSNGHIETMPAREINPFTALTRIRPQFLRTQ